MVTKKKEESLATEAYRLGDVSLPVCEISRRLEVMATSRMGDEQQWLSLFWTFVHRSFHTDQEISMAVLNESFSKVIGEIFCLSGRTAPAQGLIPRLVEKLLPLFGENPRAWSDERTDNMLHLLSLAVGPEYLAYLAAENEFLEHLGRCPR